MTGELSIRTRNLSFFFVLLLKNSRNLENPGPKTMRHNLIYHGIGCEVGIISCTKLWWEHKTVLLVLQGIEYIITSIKHCTTSVIQKDMRTVESLTYEKLPIYIWSTAEKRRMKSHVYNTFLIYRREKKNEVTCGGLLGSLFLQQN